MTAIHPSKETTAFSLQNKVNASQTNRLKPIATKPTWMKVALGIMSLVGGCNHLICRHKLYFQYTKKTCTASTCAASRYYPRYYHL